MNRIFKKALSIFLSTAMLVPVCMAVPSGASATEPLSISDLKVCSRENPVGIDTAPIFSWQLSGEGRAKSQSAYRIIVSTTEVKAAAGDGDVWDSGKISSEDNYDITYSGEKLASKTKYYWAAQVFDESNNNAKSEVASFITGIFDNSEWQGEWIGKEVKTYDIDMTGAKWIWRRKGTGFGGSPAGTQYARKSFTINPQKTVKEVLVGYSADDQSVLFFNGIEQGSSSAWSTGGLFDATAYAAAGTNTVAISGYNTSSGYAGIISKIRVTYTDNSVETYVTDSSWKMTDTSAENWFATDYDDSAWGVTDQSVAYGDSPWGNGVSLEVSNSRAAVTLRKEFSVSKKISSAYAYICGLGYFDFTLNGEHADDSVLNPCNTQYDQSSLYCAYDVTNMVKQGGNAIGVELGNGFFNEIGGVWNWPKATWRDNPKLIFNLEITYTDGTTEVVSSDTDWKVTDNGPTITNGIYYGETYDARKELTGFDGTGYNDSSWENAIVVSAVTDELNCQIMEPMRRTQTYSPKEIKKLDNGSYIVYSPEMVTGWARLKGISGAAGTKITITYGEKLNSDGTVQKLGGSDGVNSNWWPHAYIQQDGYITKGTGNEEFEPKFSYKGFEYIQIDGYEGDLAADDIIIYRTANDAATVGNIETSNDMINSLHDIMYTSMLNNLQGKPTDSPVWEKNGWLGDTNAGLATIMYNFDSTNFMQNFDEIMEDCFDEYGTVPAMVPTSNTFVNNAPVWNTLYVFSVAQMCNFYGADSYSVEQYDSMRKFALNDVNGLKNNNWISSYGQWSDWCSPVGGSNPDVGYHEGDSEGSALCETAYIYGMLQELATIADRLGKTADAAEYRSAMANIKTAFNNKFYKADKGIYETSSWSQVGSRTQYRQTSNLVPLAFGLIEDSNIDAVVTNLVNDIKEKDYHLDTGVVGTKLILPVLCDYGYSDVAFKVLTQDTYPSWGYWVASGSTSTWEMWEATSRSLDHFFLGTYDEWLYSHLAGITDISDGYKAFTVKPYLVGDVSYVDASIDTVHGNLSVHWNHNEDGTATINVTVPFGSTADIVFPTNRRSNIAVDGVKLGTSGFDGMNSLTYVDDDNKVCLNVSSGTYSFVTKTNLNTVYKDTLAEAISTGENTDVSAVPAEISSALKTAVEAAKTVFNDDSATQFAVNKATDDIADAIKAVSGSEARQALVAAVNDCESENPDSALYAPAAFAKYESALLTAKKLSANYDITDEQLTEAATKLESAFSALSGAKLTNLALKKTPTALSSNESEYWGWALSYLTDGDIKNVNRDNEYSGYCSNNTTDKDHPEWVCVDLGSEQEFNNVTLYAACVNVNGEMVGYGFPKSFEIQTSSDGTNFTTVRTVTDYEVPNYGPQSFTFDKTSARYVRVYATSLNSKPTEGNTYRMQLSEMEVYNLVGGDACALLYAELSDGVISPVFDIETKEYTATVGEAVDEITVTAYATEGATIVIENSTLGSGQTSPAIKLAYGENIIRISTACSDTVIKVTREQSFIVGDMDADGKVTVSDVVAMRKVIMRGAPTADELARGDMDESGNLTVSDVVALRQKIMNG